MRLLLLFGGFIAGLIDAIAGGGGLISLPLLIFAVGRPVEAIGSNKIVGTVGALVALLVYRKAGHLDWRKGLAFTVWVTLGSFFGSSTAPFIPSSWFRWMILAICPILIWVVWRKDLWIERVQAEHIKRSRWVSFFDPKLMLSGLGCGFYDGAFGPGGGTFMFFGLFFVVKLPLLTAMAVTKLSNTCSAGMALIKYASGGYVHWVEGSLVAVGIGFGAYFGARLANKRAAQIVRPVFTVVVVLLVLKLVMER